MEKKTLVLDHGYVQLVEAYGSDERIIEAARMSTDKGFLGWGTPEKPGDEKLLRRLFMSRPQHATPFEMAGAIIEIQAPIFVFREWHRHRTMSYNEMSGRYTVLPDLYYIPSVDRLLAAKQSTKNKQGSEEGLSLQQANAIRRILDTTYTNCRDTYQRFIDMDVAREIARLVIPVSQYSRMRAHANLRNWFHFLTLRTHPAAQWEIRQYANIVSDILKERFPRTHELFLERFHRETDA